VPEAAAAVAIDRDLCIGAGQCIAYAPQTFAHDDETKAVLQELPHDAEDDVVAAVEACPMGALTLRSSAHAE
jgi:ferredoxin